MPSAFTGQDPGRASGVSGSRGSVLVGLLWCMALLAVLVIGVLHAATIDLRVARNYSDRIQARYLAMAGIERAKALLYQDARGRRGAGVSHTGTLFNDATRFREVGLGRGTYRVLRGGRPDEGGGVIFGVGDEESRLNLNSVEAQDLTKLEGMTVDIPPALADWRDGDHQTSPGGAERDYYAAAGPPSQPRNGPLLSVREFLMIRGIPAALYYGDDPHGTGIADDGDPEAGGTGVEIASRAPGWNSLFTVHSGVQNVSAAGIERVDIQSADETALTGVRGITADIAKAIVAHRGQNRFGSIADLLEVGPAPAQGQPGGAPGGRPPGLPAAGGSPSNPGGPKVIDQNLLLDVADGLSVGGASLQAGAINVNTASLEVLACLPGMNRELAQAIISFRSSNGFLANVAWLLRVPGITTELFKQLAPRLTTRSETFRILAEGRVTSSGVRQRILAIVRVGTGSVENLAWREDDL